MVMLNKVLVSLFLGKVGKVVAVDGVFAQVPVNNFCLHVFDQRRVENGMPAHWRCDGNVGSRVFYYPAKLIKKKNVKYIL